MEVSYKKQLTNNIRCVIISTNELNAAIRNSTQSAFTTREMSVGARHWESFAELTVERLSRTMQ